MDEKPNDEKPESEEAVTPEPIETQPRVITISPPAPFDDEALTPLVEAYMVKRGLSDKKQAAIKLAQTMFRLGINLQREIENVNAYVQNMSTVLDQIPDYPEAQPIKGAIAGRSALEAGQRIRNVHFPDMDEQQEMNNLFRMAQRYKVIGGVLNQAFGGGNETESGEVKVLKARLDAIDKKNEMDAQLQPIKDSIAKLTEQVGKLIEKPPEKPRESEELTKVMDKLDGINKRIDDIEKESKYTAEVNSVKDELKKVTDKLAELKAGGGAGDVKQLEALLTTLTTVYNKLQELGGAGAAGALVRKGEEGLDWKSIAITQFTEVGKEGIKAARDIMMGKEGEQKTKKNEGISEKVIDQLVMGYCMKEIGKGNFDINVEAAAAELELPPKQVADSIMRLKEKGIFKAKGEEQTNVSKKPERREGEGVIRQPGRSEAVINP